MSKIIIPDTVDEAISITRPTAIAILKTVEATWGPECVWGFVETPNCLCQTTFDFCANETAEWNPKWGKQSDFVDIAMSKLKVVLREKCNTSIIVATKPWLLEEGEFLYAGGAYSDGIAAAVSGAKAWADECIAEILISNIKMLARLRADFFKEKEMMQI